MGAFGCVWCSSWLCFEVAATSELAILSLLPLSCELKWGVDSSGEAVAVSLIASSSACWITLTGILPTLPPPTTGILLSPVLCPWDALFLSSFCPLSSCCRASRGSGLFGLVKFPSTEHGSLSLFLPEPSRDSGVEETGQEEV